MNCCETPSITAIHHELHDKSQIAENIIDFYENHHKKYAMEKKIHIDTFKNAYKYDMEPLVPTN